LLVTEKEIERKKEIIFVLSLDEAD